MRSHSPARSRPALALSSAVAVLAIASMSCGPSGQAAGEGEARNVVLISIDTCRADHLSCYGYPRETTPNIDTLAREGVLFTRALTTNPLTLPAHCSLLTGTNPPFHGVHTNAGRRLSASSETLAEVLQLAGLRTAAFVGAFPLDSKFGLDQGFGVYGDEFSGGAESGTINERPGEQVSAEAIEWLEQNGDERFFLFLHYFDPHAPYAPRDRFGREFADAPYAGEVAYVDWCIGRVLEALRKAGRERDTLIVVTADHGEALGEHGEDTHGYFAYQGTVRVPLVMKGPGVVAGHRVDQAVSVVDVAPTVLGLLGLSAPEQLQGANLSEMLQGRPGGERRWPIYFESLDPAAYGCGPLEGVLEDGWKYIRSPREELYELGRDPLEQDNAAQREAQVAARLRARLESAQRDMRSAAPSADAEGPDPEDLRRMQALGYAGSTLLEAPAFDPTREDAKDFAPIYLHIRRAKSLFLQGRYDEAGAECREILAQRPELFLVHSMLGQIAQSQERIDEALEHYSSAMSILAAAQASPTNPSVLAAEYEIAVTHFNYGIVLWRRGRLDQAAVQLELAARTGLDYAEAHDNLGMVLIRMGRVVEAAAQFERAVDLDPDLASARNNFGLMLAAQGRYADAVPQFEHAVRCEPGHLGALRNLVWILSTCVDDSVRNGPRAVELAERACEATRFSSPELLDALAVAYAEVGRFAEATDVGERALELATRAGNTGLAGELQGRLALYRARRPHRQQ